MLEKFENAFWKVLEFAIWKGVGTLTIVSWVIGIVMSLVDILVHSVFVWKSRCPWWYPLCLNKAISSLFCLKSVAQTYIIWHLYLYDYSFLSLLLFNNKTHLLFPDKAAADANAAAWAAYYAQYSQQPQAPMTPTSGAPGTTQTNGQGNYSVSQSAKCLCF